MADGKSFDVLVAILVARFKKSERGLSGEESSGYMFDGMGSHDAVYKLCDRTEIINELKGLMYKATAGEWIQIKAKIDYMCTVERDLRQRFSDRLTKLGLGIGAKGTIIEALKNTVKEVNGVRK